MSYQLRLPKPKTHIFMKNSFVALIVFWVSCFLISCGTNNTASTPASLTVSSNHSVSTDTPTVKWYTFNLIDDKKRVFYDGIEVWEAESATFQILDSQYAKDKNGVYKITFDITQISPISTQAIGLKLVKLENVDPATFTII